MRRLIPKNSKVRFSIFKGFTLIDLMIVCVAMLLCILVFSSNISGKWYFLIVMVFIAGVLLIGSGEDKTYLYLFYTARYVASRKTFFRRQEGEQRRGKTVDDLIPFKAIRSNGVIEYTGYLGAVVEIGSVSFGLLDEFDQDNRIRGFARLLNDLSQTSVIQLVKIDRPIIYDKIAENLYNKLEEAKGREDQEQIAILQARLDQIDKLNHYATQYRPYYYLVLYDEKEESLMQQIDVCLDGLSRAGLDSHYLEAKEAAVFLKYCYTRNFDERKAEDLPVEKYADYIKPDKIKFSLGSYLSDDVFTFSFAITDYPLYVGNSWGAGIFNIDNTKVVMTIKPVSKDKAIKRIDRAFVEVGAQRRKKLSDANAQETQLATMAELQQSIQNENELLFDCTLTVTAFNNTETPNVAFRKEIRRKIMGEGFRLSPLIGRQYDGFAASTVSRRARLRGCERGINSESIAAAFPFVFSAHIDDNGFLLGSSYYPVIIDIWKRDSDQYINSNGMIFGKSGSGKSFFGKTLLTNVYSENSRIFILDPENEYQTLAKNVGGEFIDVGSATQGRINPLHVYPILTDEGALAAPEVTFSAHLQFLSSFFRITLEGITSDSFEELNSLLVKTYESKGITQETDCTQLLAEAFPTFDDLLRTTELELENQEYTGQKRANLERVLTYVKKFAAGGMFANLWNGPSTLKTEERLVVFNFQSLFGTSNKMVANAQILAVMRYLDQQIINIREENRSGQGKKIHPFILVDEGYNFIDPKFPVALDFIFLWYKRIRKYEGSIFFLTQNLIDVIGNSEVAAKTTAIVNNSQYSFIFSLAPADLEILMDLYKNAGGINETERYEISNAGNGDCFVISSPRNRASFHVVAHDVMRKIFDEAY